MPNPHFSALTEFKSVFTDLWLFFFPTLEALFPTDEMLLAFQYSDKLHSLVPVVQTFTARTHYATYTESTRTHFLCIPLVRMKLYSASSPERLYFGKDSRDDALLITTNLTSSLSLGSTIIYPTYNQNRHFLWHY